MRALVRDHGRCGHVLLSRHVSTDWVSNAAVDIVTDNTPAQQFPDQVPNARAAPLPQLVLRQPGIMGDEMCVAAMRGLRRQLRYSQAAIQHSSGHDGAQAAIQHCSGDDGGHDSDGEDYIGPDGEA